MAQENFELQKRIFDGGIKLHKSPPSSETDYYDSEYESGSEMHLREYLRRIQRHKWIVALITVALTSAVGYYLYTQPKVFQAEARIQVDGDTTNSLDENKGSNSPFADRAYFNTQLELLESPELLRRVIKQTNLENNSAFFTEEIKARINSQAKSQSIYLDADKAATDQTLATDANRKFYVEAERLNPLVEAVTDLLSVQPVLQTRQTVKDTQLISIKFKHPNPGVAALVTNAVAKQLVESNLDKKLKININENDYLQSNIADLKSQIRRDEEKLLQYGQNYQLPLQDEKQNTVVERLTGLNRQLLEAENDRKRAEAAYNAALAPGAADAMSEINTKSIADIDAKLDDLRQKRAQLLVEVTEKFPEVQEIDKQIGILETSAKNKREKASSNLKTSLEVRLREAVAREASLRKSFNEQWGSTMNQNGAAINYRIIQQGLETNRKMLNEMQQREQENELLKAKTPNNIQVVDYALLPTEPLDQKRTQYLGLAFLFSLTLGIAGALVVDYFDDSIHSSDEVEKTLSLPALGVIPQVSQGFFGYRRIIGGAPSNLHLTGGNDFRQLANEGRNELIINGDARSPLAEAFRQLRTVLLLSPGVSSIKKLLVTSSRQGEGKTTTAINIAASLAQTGASVILIDADLRNPRLHKIFNLPSEEGLSDFLTADAPNENIYNLLIKQSENLFFFPAGKQLFDCAELLGSNRMREMLAALEPVFDYIVIDSPPVSAFADSAILAAMTDGVLLVVQENRNSADILRQTQKTLNMVGANIVGVVLNKVHSVKENYGYRYQK